MNTNTLPIEDELKHDILGMSCDNLFYLPNGGNAGDAVIAHAEYELFDKIELKYTQVNETNKDTFFNDYEKFSFIYGGGGTWCGIYPIEYKLQIFKNPKLLKCLILPSTFHNCDDVIKIFDERFTVYCRDPKSLQYCQSLNKKANFKLHCDLAFTFNVKIFFPLDDISDVKDNLKNEYEKVNEIVKANPWGTMPFMRDDLEKIKLKIPNSFDLSKINITKSLNITKTIAYRVTKLMLYAINTYDTIITNRLHVAILSYRLNKNIQLYDNSYGKVYNVAEWSIVPQYKKCKLMQKDTTIPKKLGFEQLFEHSFVISRNELRFQDVENSLATLGIHPKKWQAVCYANHIPEPTKISKLEYNILGCSTSHMSIVKMAEYLDWDCVAIFEEDCCLSDIFDLNFLRFCLDNIPPDCDTLALGHSYASTQSKYFSHISHVSKMYGSHAYILFKRGYEKYQKMFASRHYYADRVLECLNTYIVYPPMFSYKKHSDRIHT